MSITRLGLNQIRGIDEHKSLEEVIKYLMKKIEELEKKIEESEAHWGGDNGKEW